MTTWYRDPRKPLSAERAMQCITSAISNGQSDKDKLVRVELFVDAWVFGKPEPD